MAFKLFRWKKGGSLNPSPPDDAPPGDGFFNDGWQNGSLDDDRRHVHQYARGRTMSQGNPAAAIGFANGWHTLDGPHFAAGYQSYIGVQPFWPMRESMAENYIGRGTLIMRPPIIPRNSASARSVRNAITFVQTQPYQTWAPIIPPLVSRR